MRILLVDCENLTGARRLGLAFRWQGFDRIELFGRETPMAPWRATFAAEGMAVAAEWPLPDDAPSQAADATIIARAEALAAARPARLVIASNDSDFRETAARLGAEIHSDPTPAQLLRLVAEARAVDGWVDAAAVGTVLAERFGLSLRGRLEQLAKKAGLAVVRGKNGMKLRLGKSPSPLVGEGGAHAVGVGG